MYRYRYTRGKVVSNIAEIKIPIATVINIYIKDCYSSKSIGQPPRYFMLINLPENGSYAQLKIPYWTNRCKGQYGRTSPTNNASEKECKIIIDISVQRFKIYFVKR